MDEQEILRIRARSNHALATRDLPALSRCWAPNYTVVTSTNANGFGRADSVDRLTSAYRDKPDLLYVRDPLTVQVFEAWGMAAEHGTWRSTWGEPPGTVTMGGTYFAKWQKYRDAGWLIQAELFVPAYCNGGASCVRELPVAAPEQQVE